MWTVYWIWMVTLTVSTRVRSQGCSSSFSTNECYFTGGATIQPQYADVNKYFIIGGLFDIHTKNSTEICGPTVSQAGLLNLMAFFWGIEYYSITQKLVQTTRVSVGAIAFDNCMRPELTLQHVLGYSQCDLHIQTADQANLVAYIGPYTNEDAFRTGTIASDLGITLISPSANSLDFNSINQKTLLRLSPSFTYDVKAIIEFLKQVKSQYVMVVFSGKDNFWKAAFNELKSQMDPSICIQYTADINTFSADQIIQDLNARANAKYVVPLMSTAELDSLTTNFQSIQNNLVFILNSVIGQDLAFLQRKSYVANNAIIVDQVDKYMSQEAWDRFKDFVNSGLFNSSTVKNIPSGWLVGFTVSDINLLSSPVRRGISRTLKSVESVLKGIDTLLNQGCSTGTSYQFCDAYRNQRSKKDDIFRAIRMGFNLFNDNELSNTNVNYVYYRFSGGGKFDQIGTYSVDASGKSVPSFSVNLFDTANYGNAYSIPSCPFPGQNLCCEASTTTVTTTTSTTSATTAASNNGGNSKASTVVVQYPVDQAITGAYSNMDRDSSEYGTRFDLGHKWIIALGVLAGVGILSVIIFEIYILYKLLGTEMRNKWRTMWLGQLLLFGIFLCYLVLFAYLPIPTKATCGITRFGVGVSYAFCFAVLLVKLMVILTSKSSDILVASDGGSPNYLKGIYQFLLFVFAVGVQIVIDVQWLITVPPEAIKVMANNGKEMWICNHYTWEAGKTSTLMSSFVRTNFENHLMSLIYIMVMILITTILSLNAHGIITNHRESIFIGIAAGFSIPIWLAWGLIGGLNKDHAYSEEFGDGCIAFGLLITATLILFSMFLPKVRQLVNMGVEGIYLEDDRETIYAGSVIMAPSSYRGKGPGSIIYVNNPGIYNEPIIIGNGDPMATHLKYPASTYSAPVTYLKKSESAYGGSTKVLKMTDDLRGRLPQKRTQSEIAYGSSGRPRSHKGTLPRSRSHTDLGAL
ncbi:metabotropic glutamate receptor 3-like isoform X2 [Biomphalaria glabrata]|uniref:Metabotropic glutamate receptor 3-like isoform X2 n=1 Tax=Biomphalaria glabrata TaxID=6526 RepID=A0A9W2YG75_BIOGL|nr:metabotropic glutamate receptor 3-like isoform X2 [Biomphalaria glabrata]